MLPVFNCQCKQFLIKNRFFFKIQWFYWWWNLRYSIQRSKGEWIFRFNFIKTFEWKNIDVMEQFVKNNLSHLFEKSGDSLFQEFLPGHWAILLEFPKWVNEFEHAAKEEKSSAPADDPDFSFIYFFSFICVTRCVDLYFYYVLTTLVPQKY